MSDPRTRDEIINDIDLLPAEQARFCLQALMVAGHIGTGLMQRTLEFAETLAWGKK